MKKKKNGMGCDPCHGGRARAQLRTIVLVLTCWRRSGSSMASKAAAAAAAQAAQARGNAPKSGKSDTEWVDVQGMPSAPSPAPVPDFFFFSFFFSFFSFFVFSFVPSCCQARTFLNWLNLQLGKADTSSADLVDDLKNGVKLCQALEVVSQKKLKYSKTPKMKVGVTRRRMNE